jgi:hypothetical protein
MKSCGICSHPERARIDACLVDGGSLRTISGQFGTSRSALDRHRKHLAPALTLAKHAEEVAEATTLLSRVEKLMSRCEAIADKATDARHWPGAIGALREMRGCLELLAKLSGELSQGGNSMNIGIAAIPITMTDPIERKRRIAELLSKAGIFTDCDENDRAEIGAELGFTPTFNVNFVSPPDSERQF